MNALADALVYAVTFINCREVDEDADEDLLDQDVDALESIAYFLRASTPAEEDALAAAAERALAAEQATARPRAKFVEDYKQWMEEMFGEDWVGNRRVEE